MPLVWMKMGIFKSVRVISFAIILFFLASCTQDEAYVPTLNKYTEDTDLMIKICKKFSDERESTALRRVVLAMQNARTITCSDYNGECKLYHEFESLALSLTENGTFADGAQSKLHNKLSDLISAVNEGKKKLQANK